MKQPTFPLVFGPLTWTDDASQLQVATLDALIALWKAQGRPGTMIDFADEFTELIHATIDQMSDDDEFDSRDAPTCENWTMLTRADKRTK